MQDTNEKEVISADEKKKKVSALDSFKKELEAIESPEEKLRFSVSFMRNALSQSKAPRFKDFWEAKKVCLPLFKEKITPAVKNKYWTEYTELSLEAKRLKEILDEQSSYALEQLELALKALQSDLDAHEKLVLTLPKSEFLPLQDSLVLKVENYEKKQREIQFYMTLAARVKELRKEVITTEMRIRHKNKLLKDLSEIGDRFLPKKKQLIKEISISFIEDAKQFSEKFFDLEKNLLRKEGVPFFKLKEEIKAFQAFAKVLSLNSQAFSQTRLLLSLCWECMRVAEKEKKKVILDKREEFKGNIEKAKVLVEAFEHKIKDQSFSSKEQISNEMHAVAKQLRDIPLLKEDVVSIKAKLKKLEEDALSPLEKKEKDAMEEKQKQQDQRKNLLTAFKEKTLEFIKNSDKHSLHEMQEFYDNYEKEKIKLKAPEVETLRLNELKREFYEVLLCKRESEITSDEEQKEALERLFKDWENFKEETRARLEGYRKEMGSSGFDFTKAMVYSEYLDFEKQRLDRAIEKVEELEERLES